MTNITKISFIATAIFIAAFAIGVLFVSPFIASAFGEGDWDGDGCCEGGPSEPSTTPTTPTKPTKPSIPETPSTPSTPKPAVCVSFTFGNGSTERTLPNGGGTVTLKWDTTRATSVSINQGIGAVAADGSMSVNITGTKTFKLTAKGAGGNDTCTITVTVLPPVVVPAVCESLTANKTSLPHGGGDVTFKWNTSNTSGKNVSINGIGSNLGEDGERIIKVTGNGTYTLSIDGVAQNNCKVTITVATPTAAKCDNFFADRTSLPHGGGDVRLKWNTTNASSVSINQGIGAVGEDGERIVFVGSTKTFTLTINGQTGSVNCKVTITVGDAPVVNAPRCVSFNVSPNDLGENGGNVTLTWETSNASSVSINQGIGYVSADGSKTVHVSDDTTFKLTVTNSTGSVDCQDSVTVEDEDDEPSLKCDLNISDRKIEKGDEIELSWKNGDVDDIRIRDDHGNTIVDTKEDNDYDEDRDEIELKPREDTEYTMTVYKGNERKTCKVEVEVEDEKTIVKRDRDQEPLVASVSLTEVPYTGFEAGPFMTGLFYTLLALWGLAMAYFLVIKRGSALKFAAAAPVAPAALATASAVPAAVFPTTYSPVQEVKTAIENHAHSAHVLLSADAASFIASQGDSLQVQLALLDTVIATAKAHFPTEDGWMVINKARIAELLG